jgi:hypothetical protein
MCVSFPITISTAFGSGPQLTAEEESMDKLIWKVHAHTGLLSKYLAWQYLLGAGSRVC